MHSPSVCARGRDTFFLGHGAHVQALWRVVAPDLAQRCAQEPTRPRLELGWRLCHRRRGGIHALAIVLNDTLPQDQGWDVEVLATDTQ